MSMNTTDTISIATCILRVTLRLSISVGFISVALGLIGNIINIIVFTKLKIFRTNRCIFYLIVESISDIAYCLYFFVYMIFLIVYPTDLATTSLVWCRWKSILGQSIPLVTFFTIATAAADQFFSTNSQLNLRQLCTIRLAYYVVFEMIIASVIHSIIFSFFLNIVPLDGCIISHTIAVEYATYFFYPILAAILPIVIASFFSALAYRNVRRIVRLQLPIERRQFDRQITAMILLRVVCFVCFVSPYIVYRIYIINVIITSKQPLLFATNQLVQAVVILIINLNYTTNFYIFIASSSQYRRQVKNVLTKKIWRQWKQKCCSKRNVIQPHVFLVGISSNDEFELESRIT